MVKGAPPPNVSPEQVASAARRSSYSSDNDSITAPTPPAPSHSSADPLTNLPSSPAQIHLNLLILESSLRAQYLCLRARLRLYLVLMAALAAWILTFTYLLFLRPREDGKGTGGSVYWVLDMAERLGWVGGMVTGGLVWATGMWDRGVRWPRRWVGTTNRGLRAFNLKLVVIRGPWWREAFTHLALRAPLGLWGEARGMRFQVLPRDIEKTEKERGGSSSRLWEHGGRDGFIEEDVAFGGDAVKLLLLPKPFSPDFREDWDNYRAAYWEKENERRALLRAIIKTRNRDLARRHGGYLWWTGWRGWKHATSSSSSSSRTAAPPSLREKQSYTSLSRDRKPPPRKPDPAATAAAATTRDGSPTRSTSSRSSTPEPETRPPRRHHPDAKLLREGSMTRKKRSQAGVAVGGDGPGLARTRSSRLAAGAKAVGAADGEVPVLHSRASNLSVSSEDDGEGRKADGLVAESGVKVEEGKT